MDSSQRKLYNYMLRLLTGRDYTQYELTQKTQAKGYAIAEIEKIIQVLVDNGFLDDVRFTENYIRNRRAKGYGPKRIGAELQTRGISAEMIAEHLQITDNAWAIEAYQLWRKKFHGKLACDYKARAKQLRFLQYRGYTHQQIHGIFNNDYGDEE